MAVICSNLHSFLSAIFQQGFCIKEGVGHKGFRIFRDQGLVVRKPIGAYPGVKFNPGFFFLCSKAFSRIIFSASFRASNHHLVDIQTPEIIEAGAVSIFFSALRTSVWSKNKVGGGVPRSPPLDLPLHNTDISLKRALRVSPWYSSAFSFTFYRRITPSLKGGHLVLIPTVSVLGTNDWKN